MRFLCRVESGRIDRCDLFLGRLSVCCGALLLLICSAGRLDAGRLDAQASGQPASASSADSLDVAIGIEGVWKIGHVTPVRVTLPTALAAQAASIEIATFDGDGVAVTYRCPLLGTDELGTDETDAPPGSSDSRTYWCTVTIGRGDRNLNVRVADTDGKILAERQLDSAQTGQALPPTQPWIVALGSSMGVEATSHSLASSSLPSFSTTVVTDPRALPDSWQGLAGCDVLIVSTTDQTDRDGESLPFVSQLDQGQWEAIHDWISHGGASVISLGDYAGNVAEDSRLRELLPGRIVERLTNIGTSPLEASTATNVQLAPIVAARLADVRGTVELSMLDNAGKRFPWWVRYSIGKGVVHFIASDLDEPILSEWKDRRLVWDKILSSLWSREQQADIASSDRNISGSAYLGYDDLTGQLRATLDHFPDARIYSFGEITFFLTLLLFIIGPLDYWISVRWLRRPDFSWYLVSTVLVGAAAGLIWSESVARPQQLLINSAQVVDFLPDQKRALVESWSHIYSSRARTIDCGLHTAAPALEQRLDWQGLPGKGLGGMESNLLSDQGMPAYTISVPNAGSAPNSSPLEDVDRRSESGRAMITGVGIPASGTKSLFATWTEEFQPLASGELHELQGIDQIEGLLVNPLSQDLLRPVLMYHNWVYQLPTRFRAGEELSLTYEMVPKDLMRRLNRRQIVNNADQITPWVPDDRQSLDRLLEIMMFYKAGGGQAYTRLQHRFQPRLDISNALVLDHAVLFGELAQPLGAVAIDGVESDEVAQKVNRTWCRVLLPVARPQE